MSIIFQSYPYTWRWRSKFHSADYILTCDNDYDTALEDIEMKRYRCVVKYDGLAGGKGVFLCHGGRESFMEAVYKAFNMENLE